MRNVLCAENITFYVVPPHTIMMWNNGFCCPYWYQSHWSQERQEYMDGVVSLMMYDLPLNKLRCKVLKEM